MRAVAYCRSRPGEPAASELALRRQREAVQEEAESGCEVVAEFIEREGEAGSEGCPAFIAARHAAQNAGRSMLFIIASRAAIGSGEVFQEPDQRAAASSKEQPTPDGMGWLVLWGELLTPSVPVPPEIVLPAGAPGPLCLYADCRPGQLDILIYLVNAGPDTLAEVVVKIHTIDLHRYLSSERGKLRWAEGRRFERRWDAVAPGTSVLVTSLDHWVLDDVSRHRLACTDPAGRRRKAEAYDVNLRSCHPLEAPWAAFRRIP